MKARAFLFFAVFLSLPARAQFVWLKWDPMAIRTDRTEPVAIELQTGLARGASLDVAAIRFDFAGGGSLMLTPMGEGRFAGSVPADKALFGYEASDVHRNFVGFLQLLNSAGTAAGGSVPINAFVSVVDAAIPRVAVTELPGDARLTHRVLNLHRPSLGNDKPAAVRAFYSYFGDDFDFINVVFSIPVYQNNRNHSVVKNSVLGIGLPVVDNAATYGSAGRLLGTNEFPIDALFDAGETAFSHETGHQWVNFSKHPLLQPGPHWPPSSMAGGVMGFNIPGGGVGGTFNFVVTPTAPGFATLTAGNLIKEFSDLDLYLMGLLPPAAVDDGVVLTDWVSTSPLCTNCATATITVNDIINANGPRVPDASQSQRTFRTGTVVITRDRLLNDDEMALLEYFAARGEAKTELTYSSGFAKGTTYPWFLATRGLSTMDLRLCSFGPVSSLVFKRTAGAPKTESTTFASCGGNGTLTLWKRSGVGVSILLNGIETPFPTSSSSLTIPVMLQAGSNTVQVQLSGKTGGTLRLTFTE